MKLILQNHKQYSYLSFSFSIIATTTSFRQVRRVAKVLKKMHGTKPYT